MAKKTASDDDTAAPAPTGDVPLSFEAALTALEQVVVRLEKGDLSLEESLVAYEAGVRLVQQAKGRLDGMQSRLEQLLGDGSTAPLRRQSDANKTNTESST
ncbi:MAG TPA: exodeoxyribonuclease VII small subunit [Myxococcota bacterium]